MQCVKCAKMFSPAYNSQVLSTSGGGGGGVHTNGGGNDDRDISSAEQRNQLQMCVFCRLKDPSRTLDQVSDHFLQQ